MRSKNMKRLITMGLLAASLIAIAPIKANAEWRKDSIGWWYTQGDSYIKNSWKEINGKWYRFGFDGYMIKGWYMNVKDDFSFDWYYLNDDGSMVTGTKEINGMKYNFDSTGKWIGYNDNEIEDILRNEMGVKEILKGSQSIVYDEDDDTDYSKFNDGFYTKQYIENYDMIERNWVNRYTSFEDELITLSSYTAKLDDIIYIKNHKRVLSGFVGYDIYMYYMLDGQVVRNTWAKLDNQWFFLNADGSIDNYRNCSGFSMMYSNQGIGLDRNTPYGYNKEETKIRTYYVRNQYNSDDSKELSEYEFNKGVENGDIVFQQGSYLGYLSGRREFLQEYKDSHGLS